MNLNFCHLAPNSYRSPPTSSLLLYYTLISYKRTIYKIKPLSLNRYGSLVAYSDFWIAFFHQHSGFIKNDKTRVAFKLYPNSHHLKFATIYRTYDRWNHHLLMERKIPPVSCWNTLWYWKVLWAMARPPHWSHLGYKSRFFLIPNSYDVKSETGKRLAVRHWPPIHG